MASKCPVCNNQLRKIRTETWPGRIELIDEPLYQVSYPGSPEYQSPRCSDCYEKMMERQKEKLERKASLQRR